MAHVRTQLRHAAADALRARGLTVFAGRATPVHEDELPCALLYTPASSQSPATIGRRATLERRFEIKVILCAADGADGTPADDTIDAMAEVVEAVLLEPGALAAAGVKALTGPTDQPALGAAGELITGQLHMSFAATVYTQAGLPGSIR